jgi:segregation and condensation protein B
MAEELPPPAEDVRELSRTYEQVLGQPPRGPEGGRPAAGEPAAPPPLLRVVEALLFVGGAPLTAEGACAAVRGLTAEGFGQAAEALNRAYHAQGRPYRVQADAAGRALVLRSRFRPVVERLYGGQREARLSPAAVEALSLVAYRQPVTKQEVDALRGADSGSLLRQLVRRGLIAVVQRGATEHREVAYGTTPRFLELFQLRSLDDLPQTQDLQRL